MGGIDQASIQSKSASPNESAAARRGGRHDRREHSIIRATMLDESAPRLIMVPLGEIRPTVFSLTRSNIEYLLAITSGRLCSLSELKDFGALAERRAASDIYHKLLEITRSMDEYKIAEAELHLPTQSS